MDVQKMGMDLANAAPDEGSAPEASGDDAKGKDAMAELASAMKSGDHEAMWHAFQGAMACAGCDLGDGAEDDSGEQPDEE